MTPPLGMMSMCCSAKISRVVDASDDLNGVVSGAGCAVAMVGALFNVTSKTLAATGDVELLTGRLISVGKLDVSASIPAIRFLSLISPEITAGTQCL